ncbi:MAG: 16S rRNA (adenine(1518)-N(6)/adenine(1519)-N(6))-dimethyltransferase RsmA [Betaproteobacteria bacterium]|nr:16S rRNA (adenine(1518)-N(6)/adenine(1519)-N(6))-dimethyltransferase RsmA [Betaproteobacteria bacterium]
MHIARKRFGQNFLVDRNIVRKIVEAIAPVPGDQVVEIGPGLGALTRPLLDVLPHLHVVEIDRDIVARLAAEYPPDRLTIHGADALKFDFSALGTDLRIVGNLPYNISTPLLFHLARFAEQLRDIHVMLQREVVERMVAKPSTSEYGRLSVMLQYRFGLERLFLVGAGAFRPAPKVESAVVRMIPLSPLPHPAMDEALLSELVTAAFSQRRKTLRNALRNYLAEPDFGNLGIEATRRPETFGVAEFVAMENYLSAGRAAAR